MARDNRSLGRFHLDGIPPAPRGVPQVEVIIDIDANSVMSITARDKATGKENKIRIEGGSKLSKEEIEQMKADAEANAEADRIERETIDKLNNADSMIFQTEKSIKEYDDKLQDDEKILLKESLDELKQAHTNKNVDELDSLMNKVNENWSTISTRLYQQSDENVSTETNDNTEDINYEEVN
jgi:molecular chaperone DnaK